MTLPRTEEGIEDPIAAAQALVDVAIPRAIDNLADFVRIIWHVINPGRPLVWNWHMDAICAHLEAQTKGQIKKLLINIPPGHSKTSLVSIAWPCWEMLRKPGLRVISASYSDQLTKKSQTDRAKVLQSPIYKLLKAYAGQKWRIQKANTEEIETSYGGFVLATSVGGQGTGRHADRVLVDDPLKAQDIYTVRLKSHITWFDETLQTRVTDTAKSSFTIVMQRLHEGDLTGHLCKDPSWVQLRLPAEFDPKKRCETPIFTDPRTKEGELLFPARFSREYIEHKKGPHGIGAMAFAAQDNQDPVAGSGNVFQRTWWRYWTDDPSVEAHIHLPETFDEVISSWDMSFKDTKSSSFVVCGIWGRKGSNMFRLGEVRGRYDFPTTTRQFIRVVDLHPEVSRRLVEDKANGPAIIAALRGLIDGIIPVVPRGSKEARAHAASNQVEAGNVYLPSFNLKDADGKPRFAWVPHYIEELAVFPLGENDDRVDETSQALEDMRSRIRSAAPFAPAGSPKKRDEPRPRDPEEQLRAARAARVRGKRSTEGIDLRRR